MAQTASGDAATIALLRRGVGDALGPSRMSGATSRRGAGSAPRTISASWRGRVEARHLHAERVGDRVGDADAVSTCSLPSDAFDPSGVNGDGVSM